MKVYRLEGKDERGVYNSYALNVSGNKLKYELMSKHSYDYCFARPSLAEDFSFYSTTRDLDDFYSACESIEKLREWFNFGLFDKLIKNRSIFLVEYETQEFLYSYSDLQIAFVKSEATRKVLKKSIAIL